MQQWIPILRVNALAAAGLAVVAGALSPWLQRQHWWITFLLAVGYVIATRKWVSEAMATPPWKRPRKGSFKERQPSRREVLQWALGATTAAVSAQIVTFTLMYTLVASLVGRLVR